MTIYYVPRVPTICKLPTACVYRDDLSVCDDPNINKGNGDAACHRIRNRDLLVQLVAYQDNKSCLSG